MEFKEVLKKDLDKKEIAIGSRSGRNGIYKIDLNNISSVVITGETGAGKSVLIRQMLKQFDDNYTFEELSYVIIDTSGVELLEYKDNNKTLLSAYNDLDESQELLFKVSEEIDRRKHDILLEYSEISIDDYNENNKKNIPYLVVVVDDNQSLLNKKDVSSMVNKIIDKLDVRLNVFFILATNNVYNEMFENYKDKANNIRIAFDHAEPEAADLAGMPFAEDLELRKILIYDAKGFKEFNRFDLIEDNI